MLEARIEPTARHGWIGLGIFLLGFLCLQITVVLFSWFVTFVFQLPFSDFDHTDWFKYTVQISFNVVLFGSILVAQRSMYLPPLPSLIQWKSFVPIWLIPVLMGVLGISMLADEAIFRLDQLTGEFLPIWETPKVVEMVTFNESSSLLDYIMIPILVVLLPGICEESFFRGFLFQSFIRTYGVGWTVVATSILFGLFHFNAPQFVAASLLGLFFGFSVYKTRSILLLMIAHMVNNLHFLVFINFGIGISVPEGGYPFWVLLIAVVVSVGSIYWIHRIPTPSPLAVADPLRVE